MVASLRFPLLEYALFILVAAAPIYLGLVTPAGWSLWVCLIALLLIAWGALVLRKKTDVQVSFRRIAGPAVLYLGALAWAVVQLWAIPGATHPLWASAASTLDETVREAVTLTPFDTVDKLLRLSAYAGVFWLALQLSRQASTARRLYAVVAVATALNALYGFLVSVAGFGWLQFADLVPSPAVRGTLGNNNHFATLCALGLIACTALLYEGFRAAGRGVEPAKERRRLKVEYATSQGWAFISCWIVLVTGLLLTLSRAGFLSAAVGLALFFPLIALAQGRQRGNAWIAAGLTVAALLVFVALSGGKLVEQLGDSARDAGIREAIYATMLTAIGDAPLEGFGLGSFEEVFRMYQPASLDLIVARGHNSYLENTLELGVPAAAAMTAAVLWLALRCVYGTFRRRQNRAIPAAAATCTVVVGLHSAVDFPLQIPAVAATYAAILGAGVAQSWGTKENTAA